jgi:glycosyltransferase involved in cell wall biosynthesis
LSHVAFLIPTIDRIGGAERQVILLAMGLRARGWRVTVVALSGSGGEPAAEFQASGVQFATLQMRKGLADPRGWWRMNRWIRCEQPEILHAHLPHAAWMARWSRLAAPVRVLIDTIHTSATGTVGRCLGYRWSRWLPDRVTAVGEGVRQAYLAAGMLTSNQVVVLPNGVDIEVWRPDAAASEARRQKLGLEGRFLWFAAGRLDPVKDYSTMLQAFAQTPIDSELVIAGSGPMEAELQNLAASLQVKNRVRFLGFEPDVRRWMQTADGFVLSSRWEGLPMGLLEAAACGLPAVGTDVSGTRDVIVDGETGWLAPAGSSVLLANKMKRLMQASPQQRRVMGEGARQRVVEQYSLSAILDRWEALYKELLERNPNPLRRARAH